MAKTPTRRRRGKLLAIGGGKRSGSAREHFLPRVERRQPATARRIVSSVFVDAHHRTDAQLLPRASDLFAHPAAL